MANDITLRQIRYFAALATAGQYRRAARQLGISQPSLSLQISALEETLGVRLLERRRSGLILTPEGRDIAGLAARVLHEVAQIEDYASPLQASLSGTLRLGSTPTIGPYLLPRVLRRLHAAYPELKLVIRDGALRDLTEDLVAGRHDIILTQLPVHSDEVQMQPLFREPLLLGVAHSHPLAGGDTAKRADLGGQKVLSLSPAYALHRQIADLCEATGATLLEEFEGTSLDALRQMVSLDMGVTLLPSLYVDSEVRQRDGDVSVLHLQPGLHRTVGLAWRRNSGNPRAFHLFRDVIRQVVAEDYPHAVTPVS
ncbi:LysR substrate-binding domain-containing protein [Ruegeria sp. 2012CJ41-6]|uniref:LysR substrate-binding domain-containing protein n=1 Tax=Ruegeria spongiae TaxID=2942209 RepID=A0ABT0Q267_9RHOB|nr:hydrogen peroxide-inducible genes activator [Ruegeria spongiae]MCL6283897.1 LysR substrate-binding domain-containing protein [Ruegeria spongiae]